MKYDQIKNLEAEKFRRLTGIKIILFNNMVDILKEADATKKAYGGRKNKLSIEDQLLMTLEYLGPIKIYLSHI